MKHTSLSTMLGTLRCLETGNLNSMLEICTMHSNFCSDAHVVCSVMQFATISYLSFTTLVNII